MLTFKEYLKEYLTPEQEERYKDVHMTAKARKATDHFFGKDNDEVKEDLKNPDIEKSEVHKAVERHLGRDITPEEYKTGVIKDKYNRDVKLGKQIKDEKLKNQFASDNTRAGVKNTTGHYVTVVRGTQVAGQTNSAVNKEHPKGHSWGNQSCKNVDNGNNNHYLTHEIKHGTVVTRVHNHTGQEIYRATLQPHINDQGHYAYAIDSEYGLKHPSFSKHAKDVAKRLSGEYNSDNLIYNKHPKVYNDNGIKTILHPNATKEHLDKALNDKELDVRKAAILHPNATKEHLDKALNDENSTVRIASIQHPNATKEHLDKALNDKNWIVRKAAILHPNVTKEHLDKALNDQDRYVKTAAVQHPNVIKEHLDKALNDEDSYVRKAAIKHPNVIKEHLDKALNDKNSDVRLAAIQHPNLTKEHLDKALNDENWNVRKVTAEHPNLTKEHLDKALNDKNYNIRLAAVRHLNATKEHIKLGLNDSEKIVKETAMEIAKKRNMEI